VTMFSLAYSSGTCGALVTRKFKFVGKVERALGQRSIRGICTALRSAATFEARRLLIDAQRHFNVDRHELLSKRPAALHRREAAESVTGADQSRRCGRTQCSG
jgi:hypothetical protein